MASLKFSKMHGLGNDFVMINAIDQKFSLNASDIKKLSDRNTGIGFDQLLIVEPSPKNDIDFGYRIFNADGGEVEQCGNGARCFAQFVRAQGLTNKKDISAQTKTTTMRMKVIDDENVSVSMGTPTISDEQIDIEFPHTIISMGNPHIVLQTPELSTDEIARIGKHLQEHSAFVNGVNVGFVQHLDKHKIKLRVYERGAGETLACGSGACAAAVAGIHHGKLQTPVTVELLGGQLIVEWDGDKGNPVWLTGPTAHVYDGTINN